MVNTDERRTHTHTLTQGGSLLVSEERHDDGTQAEGHSADRQICCPAQRDHRPLKNTQWQHDGRAEQHLAPASRQQVRQRPRNAVGSEHIAHDVSPHIQRNTHHTEGEQDLEGAN